MPRITHGHTIGRNGRQAQTPTYSSWCAMRKRCENPRHHAFVNYGGRGIVVCERWLSFESFLADMGERPAGAELERMNNARGYSPDNCVWATRKAQSRNRRSNKRITWRDETRTLVEWCESLGLNYARTRQRLRTGWSVDRAFGVGNALDRCRGSRHKDAKLTEVDVRAIRAAHAAGEPVANIARRYGVTWENTKAVVARRTWKHVT